jgi:hypothetical protein
MDLDHSRVAVIADGAAGIDPDMVEAEPPSGIRTRYQVP